MTNIDEFYREKCEKIDAKDVAAYFEFKLDDQDPSTLILDNSWGQVSIDLTPAVQDAETLTSLALSPTENPTSLQYNPERGDPNCITGDELSRIISMHLLKDVDQTTPPSNGSIYVYNDGLFYVFDFNTWQQSVNSQLEQLTSDLETANTNITTLENRMNVAEQNITNLQNLLTKPDGVPSNTGVVWGNINLISDYTNSNNTDWGLYTHNPSNTITNDEYFA